MKQNRSILLSLSLGIPQSMNNRVFLDVLDLFELESASCSYEVWMTGMVRGAGATITWSVATLG